MRTVCAGLGRFVRGECDWGGTVNWTNKAQVIGNKSVGTWLGLGRARLGAPMWLTARATRADENRHHSTIEVSWGGRIEAAGL